MPLGNGGQCRLVPEGIPSAGFAVTSNGEDVLKWDVRADDMGSFKFLDGEWLHELLGTVHVSVGTASDFGEAKYRDGNICRGALDCSNELGGADFDRPVSLDRLEDEYQLFLHVTPRLYARLVRFALDGQFPTVKVEAVELDIECVQGKHPEEWEHRMQKYVRIAWFEFQYALGRANSTDAQDDDGSEDDA